MAVVIRRRPLLRAAAIGSGAYVAGRLRQQAHLWRREQERRPERGRRGADRSAPPAG